MDEGLKNMGLNSNVNFERRLLHHHASEIIIFMNPFERRWWVGTRENTHHNYKSNMEQMIQPRIGSLS